MATFFIDPYKKYYDSLSSASGLVSSANALKEKSSYVLSVVSTLESKVSSAAWTETGHKELVSKNIPTLGASVMSLDKGICDGLVKAVDIAMNQLLPMVTKLKENDELYEKTKAELDSLVAPPQYVTKKKLFGGTETVENEDYKKYVDKKNELEKKLQELEKICKECISDSDGFASTINGLDVGVSVKAQASSSMDGTNYDGVKEYYLTADMEVSRTNTLINYGEYYVVNTAYSVVDYYNHIQDKKIYQRGNKGYQSACLGVSYTHARDLIMKSTAKNDIESAYKGCYHYFDNYIVDEEQDALTTIYNEVNAGRPVPINVKGPAGRHWVTVVGFKTNVTSASELKSEDLLILDSWDGLIERMDCSDSRKFVTGYDSGQKYAWRVEVLKESRLAEVPGNGTIIA